MTTNTKQTLVERFNSAKGEERKNGEIVFYDRKVMGGELAQLLNRELQGYCSTEQKEVLAEYRENFDWDIKYRLEVDYLVGGTCSTLKDCEDQQDLKAYLIGEKEYTAEDFKEDNEEWYDSVNYDIEEVGGYFPNHRVSNLRIKEQKHKYSVVLSIETINGEEPELGVRIPQLLNYIAAGRPYNPPKSFNWKVTSASVNKTA